MGWNKEISQKCGFLDKIRYDEIMADCGFNISEDLALCGAHLWTPMFNSFLKVKWK